MLPVLVKTDPATQPAHRGMSILMIEAGTPGFSIGKDLDKLGYKGTESAEVFLADCRVPIENLLGGIEAPGRNENLSQAGDYLSRVGTASAVSFLSVAMALASAPTR